MSFRFLYNKFLTSTTVVIECISWLINVTKNLLHHFASVRATYNCVCSCNIQILRNSYARFLLQWLAGTRMWRALKEFAFGRAISPPYCAWQLELCYFHPYTCSSVVLCPLFPPSDFGVPSRNTAEIWSLIFCSFELNTVRNTQCCGVIDTDHVCLFSWRYNPLCLYFHSPVAGFSLLVFEVSWSHATTRHSR